MSHLPHPSSFVIFKERTLSTSARPVRNIYPTPPRTDAGENPTPRKLAAMADRPGTSRGTNAPTHAQPPVTTNTQRIDGASTRMRTGTSRSHHCDQSPNDTPLTTGIHHSRVRTATHRHRVRLNAKEHGCWVVHQLKPEPTSVQVSNRQPRCETMHQDKSSLLIANNANVTAHGTPFVEKCQAHAKHIPQHTANTRSYVRGQVPHSVRDI